MLPKRFPTRASLLRLTIWALLAFAGISLLSTTPSPVTPVWRNAVVRGDVVAAPSGALFLPTVHLDDDARPSDPAATTLVASTAVWQYLDDGSIPDAGWRDVDGFGDHAWSSGPAQLGYGDGDEATVISYGTNPNAKPITTYFRHVFTVTAPSAYKALDLQLLRDDGAVVYLNGWEILRSNMPEGVIGRHTRAVTAIADDLETTVYQQTLDPALLRVGPNVLAVEVHQVAPTSSDVSFALALTGALRSHVRFAVIGDYGDDSQPEADVATRVESWRPDFVITLGDNNYDVGASETITAHVLNYYGRFIIDDPFTTRFFPSLGNHDWYTADAHAYLTTFALPGNERYYDFARGDVHFFVVDSDPHEPDGITADSIQAQWLHAAMNASTARYKIVYFHHAPYSSGNHGSDVGMQWPFVAWGASAVLAGHDHHYERLVVDGAPYFVNGLGGKTKYTCHVPVPADLADKSRVCFDGDYGAMLVEATGEGMVFTFISRTDAVIDTCMLPGTCNQ